jgi:predicted nucleic acid-binding protein
VSVIVVDSSVWIDFLAGRPVPRLEQALADGAVVLPPIVAAELASGTQRAREQVQLEDLLRELPLVDTPLDHWIRVGQLRLQLKKKGIAVSTPDAHVAQCALDLDAVLLTRDAVFRRISEVTRLKIE